MTSNDFEDLNFVSPAIKGFSYVWTYFYMVMLIGADFCWLVLIDSD